MSSSRRLSAQPMLGPCGRVSWSENEENEGEDEEGVANSEKTQQTRQALGPYMPREGWEIVSLPQAADSQENWAKLATKSWWKNKKTCAYF